MQKARRLNVPLVTAAVATAIFSQKVARIDTTTLEDDRLYAIDGQPRPAALTHECICGDIMAGIKSPADCPLFGRECVPHSPVGACMVSSEGTCKIWHQYGGHPDPGGYGAVCAR